MLISLYIKDFGLIDCIEMEFGAGLNVLTGETGAGKSIILEALQMALGGRAQTGSVRSGRDRALIQATFDISRMETVQDRMLKTGLELDDDDPGTLILSREINRQGRNTCRVNGRIVNLSSYKQIAGSLVDLHGQHDQQSLMQSDKQMLLLDRYGGPDLLELLRQTGRAYREWRKNVQLREQIISGGRERQQRMDMIKYQMDEIDAANLAGEDEDALIKRRDLLANAEKIGLLAEQVLNRIYKGTGQYPAAVDLLGEAKNDLDELCRYLPDCRTCLDNVYSALCLVEEAARELAAQRENVDINPQELDYIEDRLATIERLRRKYGASVEEILAYRKNIAAELEELQLLETGAEGLEELVHKSEREYFNLAKQLEEGRHNAAGSLEKAIENELYDLEMSSVHFAVQVDAADPGTRGINKVEFLISPNPGEPLRPLAKIASGGELSRVMLALKSILAATDDVDTLVFDEVDAGIGGRTLQAVAEKLEQLGRKRQIICVTHATAVAAVAATHYLIKKSVDGGRTVTTVHRLEGDERINELSRMLGGDSRSEPLVRHVRKLLGES